MQGPTPAITARADDPAPTGERANVQRLLRTCSVFLAVPTLTIGLAFLLYSDGNPFQEHGLHMMAFLALGILAIGVFAFAPRLARNLVPGP